MYDRRRAAIPDKASSQRLCSQVAGSWCYFFTRVATHGRSDGAYRGSDACQPPLGATRSIDFQKMAIVRRIK